MPQPADDGPVSGVRRVVGHRIVPTLDLDLVLVDLHGGLDGLVAALRRVQVKRRKPQPRVIVPLVRGTQLHEDVFHVAHREGDPPRDVVVVAGEDHPRNSRDAHSRTVQALLPALAIKALAAHVALVEEGGDAGVQVRVVRQDRPDPLRGVARADAPGVRPEAGPHQLWHRVPLFGHLSDDLCGVLVPPRHSWGAALGDGVADEPLRGDPLPQRLDQRVLHDRALKSKGELEGQHMHDPKDVLRGPGSGDIDLEKRELPGNLSPRRQVRDGLVDPPDVGADHLEHLPLLLPSLLKRSHLLGGEPAPSHRPGELVDRQGLLPSEGGDRARLQPPGRLHLEPPVLHVAPPLQVEHILVVCSVHVRHSPLIPKNLAIVL
mmetsp:Transcript_10056/g.34742  ORF Transcript_10056/g.34742 Transcript_10056/m.34742 type:complete len:376 (-) Transcript_10056:241-1368(-)